MLKNEECWVLKGKVGKHLWRARFDRHTEGQPATVAFDHEYVWQNRDQIVGWLHSHPQWVASPSATDDQTMDAQTAALGKAMVCCITGTDGLRAWWYGRDGGEPVESKIFCVGKWIFGPVPDAMKHP